jgi:hypothetical protein
MVVDPAEAEVAVTVADETLDRVTFPFDADQEYVPPVGFGFAVSCMVVTAFSDPDRARATLCGPDILTVGRILAVPCVYA